MHSVPCLGIASAAGMTHLSSDIRRAEQGPTESPEHKTLLYAPIWVSPPDPGEEQQE